MYGLIIDVKVDPNREKEARDMLSNMVVPRARTHKGIVAGYWLRDVKENILRTVELYDNEANTNETRDRIRSQNPPPNTPITLVSINTYEVIAQV